MNRYYEINTAEVTSEIIDGEAIMVHKASGDYFSVDGLGCLIWKWIGESRGHSEILGVLKSGFAREPAEIAAAVDSFLADLLTHKLVMEVREDRNPATNVAIQLSIDEGSEFMPPLLNVYSDMRELLLLDPIHHVDEDLGWPIPKQTKPSP